MATYSGLQVDWDDAINSKIELVSAIDSWDSPAPVLPNPEGFYPVAVPGRTVAV
jgi:myo-inositol 2-dehydrogenase / D-chiro-inositol 1-dehydrogenase